MALPGIKITTEELLEYIQNNSAGYSQFEQQLLSMLAGITIAVQQRRYMEHACGYSEEYGGDKKWLDTVVSMFEEEGIPIFDRKELK